MSDYPEGLVIYYNVITKQGIVNTTLPLARSVQFAADRILIYGEGEKLLATFNWNSVASILPLQTVGPADENLQK